VVVFVEEIVQMENQKRLCLKPTGEKRFGDSVLCSGIIVVSEMKIAGVAVFAEEFCPKCGNSILVQREVTPEMMRKAFAYLRGMEMLHSYEIDKKDGKILVQ
jgi:hypothetical protein